MTNRGRPRHTERKVRDNEGARLTVTWQLAEAGFNPGDTVNVVPKDGYVVIQAADTAENDLEPTDRENIPETPIESAFEAHTVGNRLWELGSKYEDIGNEWIANETKHLARRFHAYANDLRGNGGFDE